MFSPKRPVDESLLGFVLLDPDLQPWQEKAVARCETHLDSIRRTDDLQALVVSGVGKPEIVAFTSTEAIEVSKAGIGRRMGILEIAEVKRIPKPVGGYVLSLESRESLESLGERGEHIRFHIASEEALDGVHAIIGGLAVLLEGSMESLEATDAGGLQDTMDVTDQLARLVEMHASGALTDSEFAEAKAAVLRQH